ncbi:hypothetical protein AKJ52_00035 [candidate division MSBL1 archaeon SCGC-AAA382C18]|uniref:Uncharacterized protein n=1 Tax=candidate division MSBL1 archaeon SCGC-AAA382C18 TaxID=1698281 RepID=A0A133VLZ3_9EURY|nr:hypothetical protein AKJ52_00035 [candidate division MSBL1 archaeon SCGC-AAA382C18]
MSENAEKSLSKFIKGSGIVLIGLIISKISAFSYRIPIARVLGKSQFGLISLGVGIMTLLSTVVLFGFEEGITRKTSIYKGKNEYKKIKKLFFTGASFTVSFSLMMSFLTFTFSDWISKYILHTPKLTPVLKIFSIGIPLICVFRLLISTMRGIQRMDYRLYMRGMVVKLGRLITITGILIIGGSLLGTSIAYIIPLPIAIFLSLILLRNYLLPKINRNVLSMTLGKEILIYSLPILFSGIAWKLLGWVDSFMLAFYKSSSVVGLYNVARPVAGILPVGMATTMLLPVLSEKYGQKDKKTMNEVMKTITRWILIFSLSGTVGLILLSKNLILFLFGSEFLRASQPLIILAIGYLIFYPFLTSRSLLKTIGKTKLLSFIYFIVLGSNILLNLFLIPRFGLEGAALATSISMILLGIIPGIVTLKKIGFDYFSFDEIEKTLLFFIISVTIIILPYYFLFTHKYLFINLSIWVLFIISFFLLHLIMSGYTEKDRLLINHMKKILRID